MRKLHATAKPKDSELNVKAWERYLRKMEGKEVFMESIRNGVSLHIDESKDQTNLSRLTQMWAFSLRDVEEIISCFIKEVEKGILTPVPPKFRHKYGIPCFAVWKKGDKRRIVKNASFAKGKKIALNDLILKEKCKMPTLPNVKKYAELFMRGKYFSTRDLSGAFRQIPVRKKDRKYMCYGIVGVKFVDNRLPFGISSAPASCQEFAHSIIEIMEKWKLPKELRERMLVHIDDFLMVATSKEDVEKMSKIFDLLCKELGVAISVKKKILPRKWRELRNTDIIL